MSSGLIDRLYMIDIQIDQIKELGGSRELETVSQVTKSCFCCEQVNSTDKMDGEAIYNFNNSI